MPTQNPVPSSSFDDMLFNAEKFDQVMTGVLLTYTDRLGNVRYTIAGLESKNNDLIASLIANYTNVVNNLTPLGKVYSNLSSANAAIASGEIANGDTFFIRSSSENSIADEYQNISGLATASGKSYPTTKLVDSAIAAPGISASNRNLFTTDELSFKVPLKNCNKPSITPTAVNVAGSLAWRLSTVVNDSYSEQPTYIGQFNRSLFPSGLISASLLINSVDAVMSGETFADVRIGIFQFDASMNEITGARVTKVVCGIAGLSSPGTFGFTSVALNASCKYVSLFVGIYPGSRTVSRHLDFKNMIVCDGADNTFRMPPDGYTALVRDRYASADNVYSDGAFANTAPGEAAPGWVPSGGSAPVIVVKGGVHCLQTPASVSAINIAGPLVPVSTMTSRMISASVVLMEKIGDQKLNSAQLNNLRIRLRAYNSAGVQIDSAWVDQPGNDDTSSTGPKFYTRFLPRIDITSRTNLTVAENIRLPDDATHVSFDFRIEGADGGPAPSAYVSFFNVREGADPSWKGVSSSSSGYTGLSQCFVSATGSDSNTGGSGSPFVTLDKAVRALGGSGTIYLAAGNYSGISIDETAVSDITIIGAETAAFARPLIRYGSAATGITKTSGSTHVYQYAITGLTARPPWIWLDNVPDADTLVPTSEQHALLRGRANRLECTKLWRTVATSKAAALAEMDADSTLPRCHWESSEGVMYFTMPSFADPIATSAQIYAPVSSTQGLFRNVPSIWSATGKIKLVGIDIRYGGSNTRGFKLTELNDVRVLGAPVNGFDIANWTTAINCEAAGVGSNGSSTTSDGFNGHDFARFTHTDCYSHDNIDDGWSFHENCFETGRGSFSEYNGGGGFTPALGCQAKYYICVSRKNARQERILNDKTGGFLSWLAPAPGIDNGVVTSLEAYSCMSIEDKSGFVSGDSSTVPIPGVILKAYDCLAVNPMVYGYRCTQTFDCRHSGTGTARAPETSTPTNGELLA